MLSLCAYDIVVYLENQSEFTKLLKLMIGWLKWKILTIPSIDKDVKQPEQPHIAGGNTKWYSYFGKKFGIFLRS